MSEQKDGKIHEQEDVMRYFKCNADSTDWFAGNSAKMGVLYTPSERYSLFPFLMEDKFTEVDLSPNRTAKIFGDRYEMVG